jgi:hypothetical protein
MDKHLVPTINSSSILSISKVINKPSIKQDLRFSFIISYFLIFLIRRELVWLDDGTLVDPFFGLSFKYDRYPASPRSPGTEATQKHDDVVQSSLLALVQNVLFRRA